jgi:glutathione synthase
MSNDKVNTFDYKIDETRLKEYSLATKDYCLVNGLLALNKTNDLVQQHDFASPLPVTLLPSKFPKKEFDFAKELQSHFNELIYLISKDFEFLRDALKDVIKYDDFTRRLWDIYAKVNEEGVTQPISFCIVRNDYMVDQNKENQFLTRLSQIEINTISCSFGAATSKVKNFHDYMLDFSGNESFKVAHASNENLSVIARNMVNAWEMYQNPEACVVFIVSMSERNIGDQRLLEYKCKELNPKIRIVRYQLGQVASLGKLDETKRLIIHGEEVALVYYRAGYDPSDYLSEKEWDARLMIERSNAIKSPTVQAHLVGAKIVQQKLFEAGSVERFIKNKQISEQIRATFVDLLAINESTIDSVIELIQKSSDDYVLKPQREGGGHNIYKKDILDYVAALTSKKDLMSFILMKLVRPELNQNYMVKTGCELEKKNLICELGIFGTYIANDKEILANETGGYLLRSKLSDVNEGGVNTGFSALDSILLI